MRKILFICHGNICRSPMAEFVMKMLAEEAGLSDEFEIASAATSREEIFRDRDGKDVGNPVYPPAKKKLAEHGIECEGKRARQLTREDYDHYDLLICMDQWNIQNTRRIVGPDPKHKIRMLLDYAGRPGEEVSDPWYTGDFEAAWQDVLAGCKGLLGELIDGGIKPRDVDGTLVKETMKELGVDLTRQAPGYKTLQD